MRKFVRLAAAGVAGLMIATTPVALVSAGAASAATAAVTPVNHDWTVKWPTVGQGARGQRVFAIQYLLKARGYKLTADGKFGAATKAAVKNFQKVRHLRADGVVGPQTWPWLVITLWKGKRGWAVRGLQTNLRWAYGYKIAVDGIFGKATWYAVLNFQRRYGLVRDGIVGLATWQRLIWFEK
jgi:peptidoglycan hydrolase-like protein with peptidoglycan-binding domain